MIFDSLNANPPAAEKAILNFSGSWILSFKKPNEVCKYTLHGEFVDAYEQATAQELPELRENLARYALNDI